MFRFFMLGGACCFLVSSTVYFRLFLRRDSYISPLDYARALSGSRALDRRLSHCVIRDVTWLKFFCNIQLPFLAAIALVFAVMPGGAGMERARAVWIFAACATALALLTVKLFSRASFVLLMLSHAALAVAIFLPVPFLGMAAPVALAVIVTLALAGNAIYLTRRRGLFFAPVGVRMPQRPPETGENVRTTPRGRQPQTKEPSPDTLRGRTPEDEEIVRVTPQGRKAEAREGGRAEARERQRMPIETGGEREPDAELFTPDMLTPSDRLEWMLSESGRQKPDIERDIL